MQHLQCNPHLSGLQPLHPSYISHVVRQVLPTRRAPREMDAMQGPETRVVSITGESWDMICYDLILAYFIWWDLVPFDNIECIQL